MIHFSEFIFSFLSRSLDLMENFLLSNSNCCLDIPFNFLGHSVPFISLIFFRRIILKNKRLTLLIQGFWINKFFVVELSHLIVLSDLRVGNDFFVLLVNKSNQEV